MSERIAHQLAERLGEDAVAAHHGSLSTERRIRTEYRLRAGDLKALVATASLELGIDIGPVELVCQVGSPRSIATFLQRVGRSNHSRHGTPKGRLWPLTRDELIECLALIHAVHQGQLDAVRPPEAPLDILVQQLIAEAAADDTHTTGGLYDMFTKAAPYASLTKAQFDEAVQQGRHRSGHRPGPPGAPTSTTTPSTKRCGADGGPGWPLSPPGALSARTATTGWWPSPTTPSSAP